jgi:hypothetical protein
MNFEAADIARLARFWQTERLAQTPGLMAVELFEAIGRGGESGVDNGHQSGGFAAGQPCRMHRTGGLSAGDCL